MDTQLTELRALESQLARWFSNIQYRKQFIFLAYPGCNEVYNCPSECSARPYETVCFIYAISGKPFGRVSRITARSIHPFHASNIIFEAFSKAYSIVFRNAGPQPGRDAAETPGASCVSL